MSLWQELESLQKKKAELDDQLLSVAEKEQYFLGKLTNIVEKIKNQKEHIRELEIQLNDKYDAVSKLESRIAELEKSLKRPVKEPAMEESEKQPIEMTIPAVSHGRAILVCSNSLLKSE